MDIQQAPAQQRAMDQEADFLTLHAVDHIELWVGNARQAAYFYQHAYGFTPVAYAGLETGQRDFASYVMQQGSVRLVLTASYHPTSEIAAHHLMHGDGVRVVAFRVDDAEQAYQATVSRGAQGVLPPTELTDSHGRVGVSAIRAYGDTLHKFVARDGYTGAFLPGYRALDDASSGGMRGAGIAAVDHIVGNVELGKMQYWVNFYHQVMGFRQLLHFDDQDITTEYSALMSKVMQNDGGRIKLPINEPAEGRRRSQIEEYLTYYHSPGVQHIALATGDILYTVSELRARGVEFLRVPDTYYADLPARLAHSRIALKEDLAELARQNVLIDADEEGYLLQLFTKPVQDRPTVFFEIIQRHGSRGFGKGNFKALFEAIEREQDLRGNL